MERIIFVGIVLIIVIFTGWNLVQIAKPMGNPMGLLEILLLIALLSIIWIFLPVKLYKKDLVRWFSYFFTGAMFLIFLVGVYILFKIPPEGAGGLIASFILSGTIVGALLSLVLFLKIRKALKEIKEEKSSPQKT